MRTRVLAILVGLLAFTGCGLTWQDVTPGGPTLAEKTFAMEPEAKLAQAIDDDDPAAIDAQLAAGTNPNAVGKDRVTMLQFAVQRGSVIGVEKLLAREVDPDVVGQYGQTPLHAAVTHPDAKLTDLLLAAGADVNARSVGLDQTPLYLSVGSRNPDRVRRLLTADADPKLVTRLKDTPLHEAGRINAGSVIVALLDGGVDPRAKNSGGATFQDYYFGYDKAVLNDQARAERATVAGWLRAAGVPVDPRA